MKRRKFRWGMLLLLVYGEVCLGISAFFVCLAGLGAAAEGYAWQAYGNYGLTTVYIAGMALLVHIFVRNAWNYPERDEDAPIILPRPPSD